MFGPPQTICWNNLDRLEHENVNDAIKRKCEEWAKGHETIQTLVVIDESPKFNPDHLEKSPQRSPQKSVERSRRGVGVGRNTRKGFVKTSI